jgi:geranylgeranyl pyrophosphate synthase
MTNTPLSTPAHLAGHGPKSISSPPRSASAPVGHDEVRRRFQDEIERRIHESIRGPGLMGEMLVYHLATGGKRMRALLPVWACINLGGRPEAALDLGVGLELLHNATLIHDDLQDGDTHRRGQPTVWYRWGAAQAINAGDALIFKGLERITHAPAGPRLLSAITAALSRLASGQAMELELQLPPDHEGALAPARAIWEQMARAKTGALFAACLRAGAAAAEQDETLEQRAAAYGEDVGLLFQVQDDYLDLVADKGRLQRGSDLVEGKLSFPVVWALENGSADDVAPLRALLAGKREERSPALVAEALSALHRSGALAATAAWLAAASAAAEAHPMAEIVPGWASHCLAPVKHMLRREEGQQ